MFCPNCGKSDQEKNSFCRQCGTFLPDFDKIKKREISPEEHLKVNSVLNLMTAIVSITLAILLYSFFLGGENTPSGYLYYSRIFNGDVFLAGAGFLADFAAQKTIS